MMGMISLDGPVVARSTEDREVRGSNPTLV